MRFKKILRSPTSNHSLNARSPLGNDERSFAVRGRSSGSCNVGAQARQPSKTSLTVAVDG